VKNEELDFNINNRLIIMRRHPCIEVTGGTGLRKRFNSVPRGPPEWGELLYEPHWAKERRFKDPSEFLMGFVVVIAGAAFVVLIMQAIIVERPPLQDSLILLVAIPVLAYAINMTLGDECRRMPFRVYEAGCTNDSVPMVQGFLRREMLIPNERVRSIDIKADSDMGTIPSHMEVSYEGPAGERILNLTDLEIDPLAVMLAFQRTVPDKLDEKALGYMGVEDDGPVVGFPSRRSGRARTLSWILVSEIVAGVLFAVLMGAFFVARAIADPTPWRVGVVLAIVIVTTFVMTMMVARTARSDVLRGIEREMHIVGDRLEWSVAPLHSFLLRVRSFVPLREIAEVRKGLTTSVFIYVSIMAMRSGDRFTSDIEIYQTLRDREDWVRDGVVLRNTLPEGTTGGRIAELGLWKGFALVSLLTLIALLSGCVAFLLGGRGLSSPEPIMLVQAVFLLGGMIVMATLMILLIVMKSREARLVKSLFVSDKGISVREVRGDLSWIDIDEIESCTINETRWGRNIEIATERGTLRLPMSAYEKLTEGGMCVEDPLDEVPSKLEKTSPPQPPSTPP
jgi:hypothetical protein